MLFYWLKLVQQTKDKNYFYLIIKEENKETKQAHSKCSGGENQTVVWIGCSFCDVPEVVVVRSFLQGVLSVESLAVWLAAWCSADCVCPSVWAPRCLPVPSWPGLMPASLCTPKHRANQSCAWADQTRSAPRRSRGASISSVPLVLIFQVQFHITHRDLTTSHLCSTPCLRVTVNLLP